MNAQYGRDRFRKKGKVHSFLKDMIERDQMVILNYRKMLRLSNNESAVRVCRINLAIEETQTLIDLEKVHSTKFTEKVQLLI